MNTKNVIFIGLTFGLIKKNKSDQNITYKIPPKELLTHVCAGPK